MTDEFDYATELKLGRLLIKVWDKKTMRIIDNLLGEFDRIEIKKSFQSKYNAYVCYDYEPFCIDGFIIQYEIKDTRAKFASDLLKFIEFLAIDRMNRYANFEKQFTLSIDLRSKDGQLIKKLQEA